MITDAIHAEKFAPSFDRLDSVRNVVVPESEKIADQSPEFQPFETGPDTPALIIYTSGTTGPPKGALHGHRVLLGHLPGVEMFHNLLPQEDDVFWTPADWAWIGGLMNVLMPALHHGIPVVASKLAKFDGETCQNIIDEGQVKNIFFPPTALRMLKAEGRSLSGLRTVGCGGEPLGAEMLQWGRQALGLTINEFYGQTECNLVVATCARLFDPQPGCMGKPVPGHEVAVIDAEGRPTNQEGDIAVHRGSASMMLEY
ncbi:MAG: AMP-binding protein, partial [Bacteroidota bacterium]